MATALATSTTATTHSDLDPFLQPDFSAANYLNTVLPSLSAPSRTQTSQSSLLEIISTTNTLLSTLTAQTSKTCATLSTLTDEILRSGTRLGYEVDILRGEAFGLSEALGTGLKSDIARFVDEPGTGEAGTKNQAEDADDRDVKEAQPQVKLDRPTSKLPDTTIRNIKPHAHEPESIQQLRTLALVRTRLDAVVKTFGEAMEWPVAPSEMASSLISVHAPDPGEQEREEKARVVQTRWRDEVMGLLKVDAGGASSGLNAARKRIEELRSLSTVWKGTVEEKPRNKFVDGLEEMVDAEVGKAAVQARKAGIVSSKSEKAEEMSRTSNVGSPPRIDGGYGFINNLRRLKGDIFLE